MIANVLAALALFAAAGAAAEPAPLLVYLGAEPAAFESAAASRGWQFAAVPDAQVGDATVRRIETAVAERSSVDTTRIYLAGRGAAAAAVFYTVSRRPDLWAAAVAAGGAVQPAIETNRLFGAGAQLIPILWAAAAGEADRAKLAAKGFNIELTAKQMTIAGALDWLAEHKSEPYPGKIDCESGSTAFTRCYWARIATFDPAARNDVLPPSRVAPGPGAFLALGGFGYNLDDTGPGVRVTWLPHHVGSTSVLQVDDRIVSVGGTQIKDPKDYAAFMAGQNEERALGVVVLRGKERLRLETKIALTKREENLTARLRAEFLMDGHQLLLITRGINALRLDLPSYWTPCTINWNGSEAGQASSGGCWSLKQGGAAEKCQP